LRENVFLFIDASTIKTNKGFLKRERKGLDTLYTCLHVDESECVESEENKNKIRHMQWCTTEQNLASLFSLSHHIVASLYLIFLSLPFAFIPFCVQISQLKQINLLIISSSSLIHVESTEYSREIFPLFFCLIFFSFLDTTHSLEEKWFFYRSFIVLSKNK
jgi:hypothetical protein